jgi:hypothetical protein
VWTSAANPTPERLWPAAVRWTEWLGNLVFWVVMVVPVTEICQAGNHLSGPCPPSRCLGEGWCCARCGAVVVAKVFKSWT